MSHTLHNYIELLPSFAYKTVRLILLYIEKVNTFSHNIFSIVRFTLNSCEYKNASLISRSVACGLLYIASSVSSLGCHRRTRCVTLSHLLWARAQNDAYRLCVGACVWSVWPLTATLEQRETCGRIASR